MSVRENPNGGIPIKSLKLTTTYQPPAKAPKIVAPVIYKVEQVLALVP